MGVLLEPAREGLFQILGGQPEPQLQAAHQRDFVSQTGGR